MKNKGIIFAIVLVLIVATIFILRADPSEGYESFDQLEGVVYTSFSCGCCDIHASYMQRNTNMAVDVKKMDPYQLDSMKEGWEIPSNLRTCHTTLIGDYFVEGHVPLEAINKLLLEQPDIKGIALPGMPSGSPGMPGAKTQDFVITAINNDGTTYEFMRI